MARSISCDGRKARLGWWGSAVVLIACSGLSGCSLFSQPDLDFSRVDGFRDSVDHPEAIRATDNELRPFAITNKGMAIERSLGVQ